MVTFAVEFAAENLEPGSRWCNTLGSPLVAIFPQGESLIRDFIANTILIERLQVDANRVAMIQLEGEWL
jgi:hypothetical protein